MLLIDTHLAAEFVGAIVFYFRQTRVWDLKVQIKAIHTLLCSFLRHFFSSPLWQKCKHRAPICITILSQQLCSTKPLPFEEGTDQTPRIINRQPYRESECLRGDLCACSFNRPARIPLVTPGMPWISVTLLSMKYLSQVALRRGESQNMRHSWVVTVPFADSMVLAHTSNVFHIRVRLPKMHTLYRERTGKENLYCHFIVTVHCFFGP